MFNKSESIQKIASALGKFQREVGKITKDAVNPAKGSTYATLSAILNVINEPLYNNGLSFTQHPTADGGLTTILMHESGEFFESAYHMTPRSRTPHDVGAAITYQRRYGLVSILGLNIEDDNDGNETEKKETPVEAKQRMKKKATKKVELP